MFKNLCDFLFYVFLLFARAFLVQKLLSEVSTELSLNKSIAILLVPCLNKDDQKQLEEAQKKTRLWTDYVQRILNTKVYCLPDDREDLLLNNDEDAIVMSTLDNLNDFPPPDRKVSLVIVDNAQIYSQLGPEDKMSKTLQELKTKAKIARWVALTASIERNATSFENLDQISAQLRKVFPGKMESSCELLSLLRHSASANKMCIVRSPGPKQKTSSEEDEIKAVHKIREILDDCSKFLDDHEYSLLETYGEEFMDLIEDIPDPVDVPRLLLDRLRDILDNFGLYSVDKAALLLTIQLERLKTREKYERHFLLHGMLSTTLMRVRKACEEELEQSAQMPNDLETLLRRYSSPKLLKLADILLQFKPDHVGSSRFVKGRKRDHRAKCATSTVTKPAKDEPEKTDINDAELLGLDVATPKTSPETDADSVKEGGDGDKEAEPSVKKNETPKGHFAKRNNRHRKHPYSSYEDPDSLQGIIFVKDRFQAKVLYHFLKDLSKSDDRFSFLSPQYVVPDAECYADEPFGNVNEEAMRRKQEESLRYIHTHNF